MGKFYVAFWPSLKHTTGNNFKVFFEDDDDVTPTSVKINVLHKIESTTNTWLVSHLLWHWPTERHEYSLHRII